MVVNCSTVRDHLDPLIEVVHAELEFDFRNNPDGLKLELVWTPPGTYDFQRSG